MSIIQEALKKAGGPKSDDDLFSAEKKSGAVPSQVLTRPRIKPVGAGLKVPALVLFAFFAITVFIVVLKNYPAIMRTITAERATLKPGPMKNPDTKPAAPSSVSVPQPVSTFVSSLITKEPENTRFNDGKSRFLLKGIMYLESGPQAIINNDIVMEGDVVDGATVVRITRNSVVVKVNDSEMTLRLL